MIPDSYRDLIELLEFRTAEDEVNWKSTGDSSAFVVYFDKFSLVLRLAEEGYGGPEMSVLLYDPDGEVIDSFTVSEGDDFERLTRLHGDARRKALRIDEALSKLVERLQGEGVVGDEPPPKPANKDVDDDLPF